jgi:hypothetical protein
MEIGRKEDLENRESTSLLRMKEMGIKIGTAKNEPFTGHQRKHINQLRTGTISHSTFMNMLRWYLSTYGRVRCAVRMILAHNS